MATQPVYHPQAQSETSSLQQRSLREDISETLQ